MSNSDPTEGTRRLLVAAINYAPGSREALVTDHGEVWDTQQLQKVFEVEGFMAPFCIVRRKADGQRGTVMFRHSPRFYFAFSPDSPEDESERSRRG